jgi:IMP dehydrogenase/GMP reductase
MYQHTANSTYGYSNIGLIPRKKSEVNSRKDCDCWTKFLGIDCSLPVVLSPMETVVGPQMVETINKFGGICFLPRTQDSLDDLKLYKTLIEKRECSTISFIPSIPAKNAAEVMFRYCDVFPLVNNSIVCIDVANGFSSIVERAVKEVKANGPSDIKIVTGNVGSLEGYKFLADLKVDAVRVSIGTGAGCRTSALTGVGTGPAWLIRQIAEWKETVTSSYSNPPLIIADGGIQGPREVCIAIALGADVCMMGRYFASRKESPGSVVKLGDQLYKQYAGQASFAIKRSHKYVEGDDMLVKYEGTVEEAWFALTDALQSCMSYMNCRTIEDLKFLPDECFGFLS